jgi:hypothetical protein
MGDTGSRRVGDLHGAVDEESPDVGLVAQHARHGGLVPVRLTRG